MDRRGVRVRLAGYSFLILFFELALIRYLPAYVRVFGFYLNFVLLATFLGMGVGLLRQESAWNLRWLTVPATILLFASVKYFSTVVINQPQDPDEFLWGVFFELPESVPRIAILPVVTVLFTLSAVFFVPLGALMGREFQRLRPLEAYTVDIAGSILGIITFAVFSAMRSPPVLWFGFGFGYWVLLELKDRKRMMALASTAVFAVSLAAWTSGPHPEYWSPYYRINLLPRKHWVSLHVNGSMHQWMMDLDPQVSDSDSMVVNQVRAEYLRPFKFISGIDTALVVGAGTGNDVAMLLEQGAQYIDVVEIDPVIYSIGLAAHFQKPYQDPRVHVHINDARAFLRRSSRKYDVIVFGTLDSQTLLSGMSSLRLDNYVYTQESFTAARALLKDDGSLITYHMSPRPYIATKIYRVMEEAFGEPPAVIHRPGRLFNYTFIGGSIDSIPGGELPVAFGQDVSLPRDNWPYLYLRKATIPAHYLAALAMVLVVTLVMMRVMRVQRRVMGQFDWAMFFMGVGFLLVETKSVSEMSLLFGSTWMVNVFVFASILVVILVANLVVAARKTPSVGWVFGGIFGSLALAFAVPVRMLLPLGVVGQWIVGGLVVGLPIFFAAIVFASLFKTRTNSTGALAANLLGAILGGVLEYSSLLIGFKGLYIVAALAYAGALWAARHSKIGTEQGSSMLVEAA